MEKTLTELQKEFVNLRSGMFIHFNSATVQFNDSEIQDWDYGITDKDDPKRHVFDPKTWNPDKLDCKQWAEVAKSSQATFAVLTTKHHEGFSLWPTTATPHSVANATLKTDVVAEFFNAFREAGITPGIYFSIMDLHHGITAASCTKEQKELIKTQLRELLTNYGEVPFIMVDGWNAPWGGPSFEQLPFSELDEFIKSIQPNCLLMNIGGGMDINKTDVVFYENAAGQEIDQQFVGPGASCNIYTNTWFWRVEDTAATLKTAEWAYLEKVKPANQQNVTFLMNASPNQKGLIEDNLVTRFAEFGKLYQEPAPVTEIPEGWLTRTN